MKSHASIDYLLGLQDELGGVIPFERFMREALYHPEFGYYARNIRTVGRRGDFATSATLGEGLGGALAMWIHANKISAGWRWHVIEAGAGTGELARTILRNLGPWRRLGLTYHIVESSPVLRAEQRERLPQYPVRWHDSMTGALTACSGRAVIVSNELIDAFPCRIFERRGDDWLEVGVQITGDRIAEILIATHLPASSAFSVPAAEGQRIEVQVSVAEWLASWSGAVKSAKLLTVDYGAEVRELFHRRPRGTVRAFFHHQRFEGLEIYRRFGRQDLTCDVNFSDLIAWGECLGWTTDRLHTQSEFLARHGRTRRGLPHDAALADISGAGSAFKVLIQHRESPPDADTVEIFQGRLSMGRGDQLEGPGSSGAGQSPPIRT